jgi:hydroxymethylbilane synthase
VIERVIIKTHGDLAVSQRFDSDWPVGGFVDAIEQTLIRNDVDFAVHSYKDMQTAKTAGLVIAAVPGREVVNDVLVTREAIALDDVGRGFRVGTSSPRRIAQFRRHGDVEIVELRGNVPTRVRKLETEKLDGVVLAAAGLKRLGINPPHRIDLPTDRFVPAPAQGALAIQTREAGEAREIIGTLDDPPARRRIDAERAFLAAINAGCHVPVGAYCKLDGDALSLHGQLFSEDHSRSAEGVEVGDDPLSVGTRLAQRLLRELV